MKTRYLVAALVGLIGAGLLWKGVGRPKPTAEDAPTIPTRQPVAVPDARASGAINPLPDTADGPLARVYETANFIQGLYDAASPEDHGRRGLLKHLQVFFFVNDYVMAAKTNANVVVDSKAIIAAFAKVSADTSAISQSAASHTVRPYGLTEHYRRASEAPEAKESFTAVKAALTANGVPINTESDLLMDCLRYVDEHATLEESYGPKAETPFPSALDAFTSMSDTVFRHRFETRYGLPPATVSNLIDHLKTIPIRGLSPADVEIPVADFQ